MPLIHYPTLKLQYHDACISFVLPLFVLQSSYLQNHSLFWGVLLLTFFCFHVKQTIFSIRFVHCDTVFLSHKNRMEMCVEWSTKRDLWKNRIIESCWRKSVTDSARLICILMTVLMFVASPQCWTAVRGTSSSWWIPRGVCHPTSTPEC